MNSGLCLLVFTRSSQLCITTSLTSGIPPLTGWPELTPVSCAHFQSDYAIQVIRQLTYFDSTCIEHVHYKSKLLDLTAFNLDDFEKHKNYHQDWEFWSSEGEQMDPSDVVCIAGLQSRQKICQSKG